MPDYKSQISALKEPTFQEIRQIANRQLAHYSKAQRDELWRELKRGTALLNTPEHLYQYLFSFGNMHQAKLLDAIRKLPSDLLERPFEIIDWGCGQAMGTVNLLDFLREQGFSENIKKVTLIEPASLALEHGYIHAKAYLNEDVKVIKIDSFFEHIAPERLKSDSGLPVLHVFSNILDVAAIDLKSLSSLIDKTQNSDSYLLCVGPLNPNNQRIDAFFKYFKEDAIDLLYAAENQNFRSKGWTYKARIHKLKNTFESILIPIEYYPAVAFAACYELDIIKYARGDSGIKFSEVLSHFEASAPFDLGASVYEDVHPLLAVAHNIIVRGLPTKSSVFIEEALRNAFGKSERELNYGEIRFKNKSSYDFEKTLNLYLENLDKNFSFSESEKINLQLLLVPAAIARFQKVMIEALITGHLSLDSSSWKIMILEEDVPFGHLAIQDFKNLFYNLTQLSEAYRDLNLPEIELYVKSNTHFKNSTLHKSNIVYEAIPDLIKSYEFDLVVELSLFKTSASAINNFSGFKCKNNCYFDIRSTVNTNFKRSIYTSSLVTYQSLVKKTEQGNYVEIEKNKSNLTYFLQLIFRKEAFRAGQLPILDRALKNLPVIGLLPTGGGKSLTYQLAAVLQPGVTMIVDPLKSLMKDQYDGLLNNGIDSAAYINSSLNKNQRLVVENRLKSSELLFIFLSPERLSIAQFREDLKHMHDYNVYFAYGVIDEVHCVSEWGHDFRFSYLHLGRNLYNYVKAKENEISLLGLTATASFDVLADVERELSGNGAFELDTDAIVRYENTNRLELQYKIEKVPVDFEEDRFYDSNNLMPVHLPKAINITNHWPQYDSKSNYLKDYISLIPGYINDLQRDKNIDFIKSSFVERQNNEEGSNLDLKTLMPNIPVKAIPIYDQAGIVFCPHVRSTGLSVSINAEKLADSTPNVGSFSGKDNDESAMQSLDNFRDNKSPLMIATKAFGMGIDKPNVRYTVNMNYSSSLEGFIQEAGRAGRDRKIALSTILISDYKLATLKKNTQVVAFPTGTIRGKWFHEKDLREIITHYNLEIPEDDIIIATPETDIVKLHCSKDNMMFAYNRCNVECSEFNLCQLKNVNQESKGWKSELELIQDLSSQNLNLSKKNFQYLNPDYQSVMFFFKQSFKGDIIEKTFMNDILNISDVYLKLADAQIKSNSINGFLESILQIDEGKIDVFIPYTEDNYTDLAKAIYRMCCIELIEDFTQDYSNKLFKIVAVNKQENGYFNGLLEFLKRYYTIDRALLEIEKVKIIELPGAILNPIKKEIFQCLYYLTGFVYDKISEKRKRAIDDMRSFCMEGVNSDYTWVEANEKLKDYIFYYFNSKYAKVDYVTDDGEPFSLVIDTESGKKSDFSILNKYLRVIDDDIVGVGTPLDNVKHLYGAVRLISRSLTDTNPVLALLETFCLAYLGTKKNKSLENQLTLKYSEAFIDSYERTDDYHSFWKSFKAYNNFINTYMKPEELETLSTETRLLIHSKNLSDITTKYIDDNE